MYDFMTLHYGSHIIINLVLFGHLKYICKTVMSYLLNFSALSGKSLEKDI